MLGYCDWLNKDKGRPNRYQPISEQAMKFKESYFTVKDLEAKRDEALGMRSEPLPPIFTRILMSSQELTTTKRLRSSIIYLLWNASDDDKRASLAEETASKSYHDILQGIITVAELQTGIHVELTPVRVVHKFSKEYC